jgi:hypothetical protein
MQSPQKMSLNNWNKITYRTRTYIYMVCIRQYKYVLFLCIYSMRKKNRPRLRKNLYLRESIATLLKVVFTNGKNKRGRESADPQQRTVKAVSYTAGAVGDTFQI